MHRNHIKNRLGFQAGTSFLCIYPTKNYRGKNFLSPEIGKSWGTRGWNDSAFGEESTA